MKTGHIQANQAINDKELKRLKDALMSRL